MVGLSGLQPPPPPSFFKSYMCTQLIQYFKIFLLVPEKRKLREVSFQLHQIPSTARFVMLFNLSSCQLMELKLKKMYEHVQNIHDEMFYLRER